MMNQEGMTWLEWIGAVAYGRKSKPYTIKTLRKFWRAGMDPTEIAAGR